MRFVSHSQAGQSSWVDEMLEHKTGGHFVDIGCHHESFHSNTYDLEVERGYSGLMVDLVSGCEKRNGIFVKSDAANPNDALKLQYSQLPTVSDFLSLDADDSTLGAFMALPWDKVTWRVLCIETDVYRKGPEDRDKMRSMLRAMGYEIICEDVVVEWPEGNFVEYEDWACYPELCNPDVIKRFICKGKFWRDILSMS